MSKIQTYQEILDMEKQLKINLVIQGQLIMTDIDHLKEEWGPIVSAMSGLVKATSTVKTHPLLSIGMSFAADMIQRNVAAAGSGLVARAISHFLVRNASSGSDSFFNKLINRLRH